VIVSSSDQRVTQTKYPISFQYVLSAYPLFSVGRCTCCGNI